MSVLDYDPAGMDALASTLMASATGIMNERSRIHFTAASPDFVGPAADRFYEHCAGQVARLDAIYGDLMAAAAQLNSSAATVRSEQQREQARLAAEAEKARAAAAAQQEGDGA